MDDDKIEKYILIFLCLFATLLISYCAFDTYQKELTKREALKAKYTCPTK